MINIVAAATGASMTATRRTTVPAAIRSWEAGARGGDVAQGRLQVHLDAQDE